MTKTQEDITGDDHESALVQGAVEHETVEEQPSAPDVANEPHESKPEPSSLEAKKGKIAQFKQWIKQHKKMSIVGAVLVVVIVLAAVPFTRYAIAGTVIKQDFAVEAIDSQTHQPVSNATITLNGHAVATDGQGKATIRASLGSKTLVFSKKYYQSMTKKVLVGFRKAPVLQIQVTATGRQVPITIVNKITNKPLENAVVSALDTSAKTDKNGHATLVLPVTKPTLDATISASGFNNLSATVQVTAQAVPANTFAITPAGSVYFLSNLSGKVDVVKTNLDGTSRQTVLAGTGKEVPTNTVLLASRDWKYLALLSKRDGTEKLYLIDTSNDALTTMDEGTNVTFTLTGWSNDTFVYTVQRGNIPNWQSGQQALKSFNATNKKLSQLDQTTASGTNGADALYEQIGTPYLLSNGEIVYAKDIQVSYLHPGGLSGQQAELMSVHDDGSSKKVVKAFSNPSATYSIYVQTRPYEPSGLYIRDPFTDNTYYEYDNGQFKTATDVNDQNFDAAYPTYLLSPSGNKTLWSEERDGKNSLFIGDEDAKNEKQVASLSDYQVFGWYTEDYLLITKNASELYIMPADGSGQPLKVSDYYKPAVNLRGYGGGYGG